MKKNYIPKNLANGCPRVCPKCKNKDKKKGRLIVVFRTWKPNGRVTVEMYHENESKCQMTFDHKLNSK